jgi:hypothetical protein
MRNTMTAGVLAAIVLMSGVTLAADPPGLINYQGVLRNADDEPLDGTYDMIFRFFDDADPADPENEIFVDEHLASGTGAVTVTGGLFDVLLGSGNFYDGSGPGDHPHIFYVFGLHETVFLEVQIGTERLLPRMQAVSAPYAVHATVLGGYVPADFINTTSDEQEKIGLLRALGGIDFGDGADDDLTAAEVTGLTGGPAMYADFLHQHAYADNADTVDGKHANEFLDTSPTIQTKSGPVVFNAAAIPGVQGIQATGPAGGGYFEDSDDSGWAWIGASDYGVYGSGDRAGGYFGKSDYQAYAYAGGNDSGYGTLGIAAFGEDGGGYFRDLGESGWAYVGYMDEGISAHGDVQGGYFEDSDLTSSAHIAYGGRGVEAYGQEAGGYFKDLDGLGEVYVGYSDLLENSFGVWATAGTVGGYFESTGQAGYAYVGDGTHGVYAGGDEFGGFFHRNDWSAQALLASHDLSDDAFGIQAWGGTAGGYFEDNHGTSSAHLAYGTHGIEASGDDAGGVFLLQGTPTQGAVAWRDPSGNEYGVHGRGVTAGGSFHSYLGSEEAYIAYDNRGLWGAGAGAGATFSDTIPHTDVFADVARIIVSGNPPTETIYKVYGNGTNAFVQNHPEDPDKVVVYASPEGDEVATYTRGTARLESGEARISLGATFRWVTNPDVGLTAHLTPHGDCLGLYVESLSSEELVVRELDGGASDVSFDFLVMGLRIGFEQSAVVQAKDREAPLPAHEMGADYYSADVDPGVHTALQRFRQMEADVRGVAAEEVDLGGATALREAIKASAWQRIGMAAPGSESTADARGDDRPATSGDAAQPTGDAAESAPAVVRVVSRVDRRADDGSDAQADSLTRFPVSGPAEIGDLVVFDPERPGALVRGQSANDPGVVGIVAAEPVIVDGARHVELVETNYAVLKVDAGYGEIRPGDLLTASFTPGHAMRALEIVPGTIVGKALEPLETGTGSIRVLVMPR